MASSIRFVRVCPGCGKSLQIPIELLGKSVSCHSCGEQFQATTESSMVKPVDEFDLKVARLIQKADRQLANWMHVSSYEHN